jgi:hypothetical protein
LKEGEYLQITVEDAGQVTGFISRYGDGGSDKGEFVDQFFKGLVLRAGLECFVPRVRFFILLSFCNRLKKAHGFEVHTGYTP